MVLSDGVVVGEIHRVMGSVSCREKNKPAVDLMSLMMLIDGVEVELRH